MTFNRDLSFGSVGSDVMALQNALEELHYGDFVPTGVFGPKTRSAVAHFQSDAGITPAEGYFGVKTSRAFTEVVSAHHRQKIWSTVWSMTGRDVTPDDAVPDEYDCADTVCTVLAASGFSIGSHPLTTDLYRFLSSSQDWRRVEIPLAGDVIISPTGYGNGTLANGHVGFVGENGQILSNSSSDGVFRQNYTLDEWRRHYGASGGFPVAFFRRL